MIISIDSYNPKEKSIFRKGLHEEIEIKTLHDLENYILSNGYEFNRFHLLDGELKTREVKLNENLNGKLVRFKDRKEFVLVNEMIVGRELDKFNKDSQFDKSPIPMAKFTGSTWDRITHLEVLDFELKNENNKVLNKMIMSNEKFEELVTQYEKIKQTMSFTGHRPSKLGGFSTNEMYYMKNPVMQSLRKVMTAEIEQYIVNKGIKYFITGGALGVDQLAFWVVHDLKKKYPDIVNILAIPFDGFEKRWKDIDKEWFYKMYKLADTVINVEVIDEYEVLEEKIDKHNNLPKDKLEKLIVSAKLQKRNEFMTDYSFYTMAVFDRTSGGTRNCYNYACKLDREIRVLDPNNDFQGYTKERRFELQESLF